MGRLLEEQDDWELLSIPCEATENDPLGREKGEFLSEAPGGARYSKEDYETLKREMPPFEWASLFQQNPTPEGGLLFHKENFKRHKIVPWGCKSYITADMAYKDKASNDPAVICKWDIDAHGDWYADDLWRERSTPDVIANVLSDFCLDHKPVEVLLENIDETFGGALIRKVFDERGVRTPIVTLPAAGNKEQKATSYRAQVSRGKVSIKEAPWAEDFIAEHLRFPNGKNDDMVDNGSLLGRRMDQLREPFVRSSPMRYGRNTGQHIIDSLQTDTSLKTRFA